MLIWFCVCHLEPWFLCRKTGNELELRWEFKIDFNFKCLSAKYLGQLFQITPVFTSGRLKQMYTNFDYPINNCVNNIQALIDNGTGGNVECKKLMRSFSLDIIANVVFSLKTVKKWWTMFIEHFKTHWSNPEFWFKFLSSSIATKTMISVSELCHSFRLESRWPFCRLFCPRSSPNSSTFRCSTPKPFNTSPNWRWA